MHSIRTELRIGCGIKIEKSLALLMQSRALMKFGVDIHPVAHPCSGIMLDHATGLVAGETAVVGKQGFHTAECHIGRNRWVSTVTDIRKSVTVC